MKYLKILFVVVATVMASCVEDTTGDVSRVTTYPTITIQGDATVYIEQGTTYEDAGAISMAGDTELETTVTLGTGTYSSAAFGTDVADKYTITYSALNEDGFAGNALRTVIVYPVAADMATNLEGAYMSDIQRVGADLQEDKSYVFITSTGTDTYELSHAVGGYYDMGRNYGPNYAARGAIITVNDMATNDITVSDGQFPIWGNTVAVTDFTVDAANNTITFTGTGDWGSAFEVTLTKVQF
jgi:hypothetical protein